MHLAHPYMLLWLAAVPALLWACAWGDRQRRKSQRQFGSNVSVHRRWKRACVAGAAISLIVGLSKPVRKGEALREETGDIVFLLDVSRSMLSVDAAPSRLESAKKAIASIARQTHRQRMALVAFAGVASVLSPLTVDEAFFQSVLEGASPDSVSRGGTRIGEAIQFTLDTVFDDVVRSRKQLVIVSDGGDQEDFSAVAARALLTKGIKLLVIGVGDVENGVPVPTSSTDPTPILYQGQKVETKLDATLLEAVATAAAGIYVDAKAPNVDAICKEFLASGASPARDAESVMASWLILLAILLLTVESFLSDRKTRTAALALIVIASLSAQTPSIWIEDGNLSFKQSHWDDALASYLKASAVTPLVPQASYNLGVTYYRLHRYASAQDAFERAAKASPKTPLEAMAKLGAANCAYREIDDAPVEATRSLLRTVLASYEELPQLADAKFNAEVVRRRLADLQKAQSQAMPRTPPPYKRKAEGAQDIVKQGGVPGQAKSQRVDKDW